eukprot:5215338-Amphidinium_carterae.1
MRQCLTTELDGLPLDTLRKTQRYCSTVHHACLAVTALIAMLSESCRLTLKFSAEFGVGHVTVTALEGCWTYKSERGLDAWLAPMSGALCSPGSQNRESFGHFSVSAMLLGAK